ncbi:hypothetical protein [Bradyrhizobium sp. 21]|uniref:hypothetical protein n=1 Tax=Bradyrhizobium sp. 21 TaxID=2782666 RepID=UPI001FF87023|nr:hypothetical protein [Bradyrhizobium sp. 21]MCK1384859.1 hypothetical protein [Bradyrhizobium sp. 21]
MAKKIFGTKETLQELKDWVRQDFEEWYDSADHIISAVERKVHRDLTIFADQLHSHQLVKLSVRRKARESFVNKIWNKLHGQKVAELDKAHLGRRIGPEDLVQDLVGARFIMYAGRDQLLPIGFLSFWQELRVEELRIYSIFPEGSPFFPAELYDQMNRLFDKVTGVQQKDSGYESIHAIARIDTEYAKVRLKTIAPSSMAPGRRKQVSTEQLDTLKFVTDRTWDSLKALDAGSGNGKAGAVAKIERALFDAEMAALEHLGKINFEVQIRTALQDNWAQIEHQVRYGIEKAAGPAPSASARSTNSRDLLHQVFKTQTILTSALEQSQRLVPLIIGYDNDQLDLKSLTLGKRRHFFDDPALDPLLKQVDELNRQLEERLTRPIVNDNTLEQLLKHIEQLSISSVLDFRTFKIDDKPEDWGRRRYILLMLGYVLLKGNAEQRMRVVQWFKLGKKNARMPQDPYWAATYIYDHMRFVDTHFRTNTSKLRSHFCDPLLAYRVAGLAVQRGEFHKAINELDVAMKHDFLETFRENEPSNLKTLNRARFERRCAQYHWWTYLSNRTENAGELFQAISRMQKVLAMTEADIAAYDIPGFTSDDRADILKREQRSAVLAFILYSFHRYVLRRPELPNWPGFNEAHESVARNLIQLFGTAPPLHLADLKAYPGPLYGERLLVDAILSAQESYADAIATIHRAVADFEKWPGKTDLHGDRIALAREIEDFLSSLSRAYQG